MQLAIQPNQIQHQGLSQLLGSQNVGGNLAAQVHQYANCPVTLAGIVEPVNTYFQNVVPPVSAAVVATAADTALGFIDITAIHIFGPIFFVLVFVIVMLALTKLINWTTAVLLMVAGFALLYLLGASYRESIRAYVAANIQLSMPKIQTALQKGNLGGAFQAFLAANQKSLVACNGANQG